MKKIKIRKKDIYITIFAIFSAVFYLWSILHFNSFNLDVQSDNIYKFILSWMGYLVLYLTIKSIKEFQGKVFTLYTIFYLFLFIFSYGQFIMWALGIHYISEMGVSRHVRFIDENTILKIQLVSLQLLSVFHLGALFGMSQKKPTNNLTKFNYEKSIMKLISIPLLIVTASIMYYYSFSCFNVALVNGYGATFDVKMSIPVKYLSYMFIPSIYMTITSYDFSKRAYYILTCIFMIYAIPMLITGDRGSWIYFIGPWIWIYIYYVRTKKGISKDKDVYLRKKRRNGVIAFITILLIITSFFVSIRGEGLKNSNETIYIGLDNLYLAFIKPIFEMGQSARILGIIIQDNLYKHWPYGNTFIADVLGMILPRVKVFFGYPDMYVENWMSSIYLNMVNYGVGFSSFAEAYLNGGLFFSWFYMILFGYAIGRLTIVKNRSSLSLFVALATTTVLGPSVRATLDLWLRTYFWGVIVYYMIIKIYSKILLSKSNQISVTTNCDT